VNHVEQGHEVTVLVHGFAFRAWILAALARRLQAEGLQVRRFSYPSRAQDINTNARSLKTFVEEIDCDRLNLLGHSLGGLVILRMLEENNDLPPGRVVLLGTPLTGSAAARRFSRHRAMRWLFGQAAGVLQEGLFKIPCDRPVAMVSGSRPLGLGMLSGALTGASDGTVAVDETRHEGLADHVTIPVTHTGLLGSAKTAELAATFLLKGQFDPGHS
jgi:pimeloyl-ACP methyl ester carboxylesterase